MMEEYNEEERQMWVKRIQARQETVERLLKEKLQVDVLFTVVRTEDGLIRLFGSGDSEFYLGREQVMQLREIISGPPLEMEEHTVKEERGSFKITMTHIEKVYHSLQEAWQKVIDELDDEVNNIQDCVGEYPFHWTHPLDEETQQTLSKQDKEYELQKSGERVILAGGEPEKSGDD